MSDMVHKGKYLVSIRCLTYNQAPYIKDALDGFVIQQTNFPFVAVVIDDASTDGEQDVINTYVDEHFDHSEGTGYKEWETDDAYWTFARHTENENCHFVVACLKRNLYGEPQKKDEVMKDWADAKYYALCEGDDYWTDPLKLQKQVAFMEEHEEYVMCCHRNSIYFENEKRKEDKDQWEGVIIQDQKGIELNSENYFQIGTLPQVLTTLYRNCVLEKSEWYNKLKPRSCYDQTMMYAFVELGKIWVMNENMGVYRRHNKGVATSLSSTQASKKMYYTWHDVYEIHPNSNTKALNVSSLRQYIYCLAKYEGRLFGTEERQLLKEYNNLVGTLTERIRVFLELIKGGILYMYYYLKKNH